jgi:4-hydroxy-3-methylbut-2-enyl diphosphate reductase
MKVLLSKPRGFCAGVVRAIQIVESALDKYGPPIYVKHEIVHNRRVIDDLRKKGAIFIEDLAEAPEGSRLIYSAHGVAPSVREAANQRRLITIDATCGLVTKVHSAAKRYAEKGYQIILIGHRDHVEIIGTAGEAPEVTTIVESVDDVDTLQILNHQKLVYLTQTTLSLDDVRQITDALKRKYPHIEELPSSSICYATSNRQMALRAIAGLCELVLVVGDKLSSNSNRLREVVALRNVNAYLINSAEEINPIWLQGVITLGLTAGASTPESIVQECIAYLKRYGAEEVEEVVYTEENVHFSLPRF